MDEQQIVDLYARVDALDAAGFAQAFTEDGSITLSNQPPARGRDAIEQSLRGLFTLLDGMKHSIVGLWPIPVGFALEATVEYSVKGVPVPVIVRGTTILRVDDERLRDVRVYYDLAPVLAAAQAAARATPEPIEVPDVVQRVEGDHRGAFVVERPGPDGAPERLAAMTYTEVGDDILIIDHTEVSDLLRGQGVARRLLDALVAWVRTTPRHVVPLCPYARSQFDRDPSLRDVLSP